MAAPVVTIPPATIRRADFLRRGAEFARVREDGRKTVGRYTVVTILPAPDARTRVGVIASKRFDRKAVVRNRARRLMKEGFRLIRNGISPPVWVVIVARRHLVRATLKEVQGELMRALAAASVLPGRQK
jgi:ribonuclease P protein component